MARRPFQIQGVMLDVGFTLVGLLAGILGLYVSAATLDDAEKQEDTAAVMLGNIAVEAIWEPGLDVDVDLWVQAPSDASAVGYSRRADRQSSYTRDDVGADGDPGDLNFETSFIRGLVQGRYVVDVHAYNLHKSGPVHPTAVRVTARFATKGGAVISTRDVELVEDGQEVTAFSFVLDAEGKLEVDSVSTAYLPLRNPGGSE